MKENFCENLIVNIFVSTLAAIHVIGCIITINSFRNSSAVIHSPVRVWILCEVNNLQSFTKKKKFCQTWTGDEKIKKWIDTIAYYSAELSFKFSQHATTANLVRSIFNRKYLTTYNVETSKLSVRNTHKTHGINLC